MLTCPPNGAGAGSSAPANTTVVFRGEVPTASNSSEMCPSFVRRAKDRDRDGSSPTTSEPREISAVASPKPMIEFAWHPARPDASRRLGCAGGQPEFTQCDADVVRVAQVDLGQRGK